MKVFEFRGATITDIFDTENRPVYNTPTVYSNLTALKSAGGGSSLTTLQVAASSNDSLVLVFGADRWPMGVVMTKAAYVLWLKGSNRLERRTHSQSLIDPVVAASLGYRFVGSMELQGY